ncbi:MAG: hypothetical protein ACRDIL_09055, partial [Candidatus Limnocylindrales bacterium]
MAWYREKLGWEPIYVGSDGPEHPVAAFAVAGSIVSLWQLPEGTQRVQEDNDRNTYLVVVVDGDLASLRDVLAA